MPPRASFGQDMTPAEAQLMQEHAAYWREWMGRSVWMNDTAGARRIRA